MFLVCRPKNKKNFPRIKTREKLFTAKEIEAIKKAKDRLPIEDLLFAGGRPPTKDKLLRVWRAAQANENSLNGLQDLAAKESAVLEKMIRNAKK